MDIEAKARMSTYVADAIQDRMEAIGTSVVELSQKTSIPRSTLTRRLEASSPITILELADIAEALGISPDDLYRDAHAAATRTVAA